MRFVHAVQQQCHIYFRRWVAVFAAIVLMTSACAAQLTAADQPGMAWFQELQKDPALQAAFNELIKNLMHDVQFPEPRRESRLLPLQQESTVFYMAFPNYGEAVHQAQIIFNQELKESPVLWAWWHRSAVAAFQPKVEDALEKYYQFSQFLGDEMTASVGTEGRQGPSLQILAEVKKPGLKDFLQQISKSLASRPNPPFHIFDAQQLAAAKDTFPPQQPVILVHPKLVIATLDLGELKRLSAHLEASNFAASPFGQRVAQAYEGGTTVVGAIDLQTLLKQLPRGNRENDLMLERSGFADVKYLVWEHKGVPGAVASQTELSFTGPRHGIAAWLGTSSRLGTLDFVSPETMISATVRLSDLAQIFDEVKALSTAANPQGFAPVTQMESALKLSFKEDLLRRLRGEFTVELDDFHPPDEPAWRAIFQLSDPASDPDQLQATLSKLWAIAPVHAQQYEEDGVTYYALQIPSGQKTTEIGYTFADGYLVIGSSREMVAAAVRVHRSGDSLAHSQKFLASLPPERGAEASALFYENPTAFTALAMRQALPELARTLSQATGETPVLTVCAYGEESAIRAVSSSKGFDAGIVLAGAAIAVPNLMRARIAANEASAVATIRTANTAQISYSTVYPERGFAPNLATLGPDPHNVGTTSADHASLIDAPLGDPSCTADAWCTKSGYKFRIKAICKKQNCEQFVVLGIPESIHTGFRSFCSTSDAVVRFRPGGPLTGGISASECQGWSPLQ